MKSYDLNAEVKIKVFFSNSNSEPINVTNLSLAVTNPNNATTTFNDNFVNPDTGFYYYNYTTTNLSGTYNYLWTATINGVVTTKESSFKINEGGSVSVILPELNNNELVVIELNSSIKSLENESLSQRTYLTFSTQYDPFYCSVDMLIMELGPWAENIPHDTLALAIHWSSLEGDYLTSNKPVDDRHAFALTKFVMYDAAINLLRMPIGSTGGSGSRKELGDLLVESGSLDFPIKDLLTSLKLERDEWLRVVNAGGKIMPGQGLGPTFAVKGDARKDARKVSREWHDPWSEYYTQPSANSKYRRPGESKYKSGYTRWSDYYFTSVTKGIKR